MILDYAKEYGNKSFEQVPINELDMLVFTALSYFDYPKSCWGMCVPDALEHVTHFTVQGPGERHPRLIKLEREHDEMLRALVMEASRYRSVQVKGFSKDYAEKSHQFGAVALTLEDVLILSYRGTDETITGWREALELSLDAPMAGQKLAQEFFEEQASQTQGPIITCGHSKGGNLAAFAAASCAQDPSISPRIAAVLSFDGPGLPEPMRKTKAYKGIAPRISAYIPKSSFIGNIHEHPVGRFEYIDSFKMFITQHFIYNWKTQGTSLMPCKQSLAGKLGSGALNLLIDNMNDAQKSKLFDVLFYVPRRLNRTP